MELKKVAIVGMTAAMMITSTVEGISWKKMVKKQEIGVIREYYSEDLTAKILRNRGDDIIIEKVIGQVTNKRKDGKTENGDYISYRSVKGAKKGDTIFTILIYEPNGGIDEVADRFDYILNR